MPIKFDPILARMCSTTNPKVYFQEEPLSKDEAVKNLTPIIGNRLKLAYNLVMACDILLNSVRQDIQAAFKKGDMDMEKKKHFYKLMDAISEADKEYEKFAEKDLTASALASGGYHVADGYRQDANELIRAMMLYIDRSISHQAYDDIITFFKSMPEGGIFSEKEMSEFNYMAKSRRI